MPGPTNYWSLVATEGAKLKREQLYREISQLKNERERSNLEHTYSKLFMFLEDDIRMLIKRGKFEP
jgi:hypothetical protein